MRGEIKFAIADLKSAAGAITFNLRPEYGSQDANTTSHVWPISNAVSGKATIVTAPVTA
jgi:hypothetical protein